MTVIRPCSRLELRQWLIANATVQKEVWVLCSRSKKTVPFGNGELITYTDVVEEALCFGWIDSTVRKNTDGQGCLQRISPRRKNSHWTDLNVQRCYKLMEAGLMMEEGKLAMPQSTLVKQPV